MDVNLNEISGVQFVRDANPFPHFAGQESLTVRFVGPDPDSIIYCYVGDLYDEQQRLRPDKLNAWTRLRDQYGGIAPA
jgi:putative heme iron utilization protein